MYQHQTLLLIDSETHLVHCMRLEMGYYELSVCIYRNFAVGFGKAMENRSGLERGSKGLSEQTFKDFICALNAHTHTHIYKHTNSQCFVI